MRGFDDADGHQIAPRRGIGETMIETRKSFCRFCHVFCGLEVDVGVAHDRIVAVRAEPVVDGAGYTPDEPFAFRMTTCRMPEVYCTQGQKRPSLRKKRTYNPVLSAVPVNACPAPGL